MARWAPGTGAGEADGRSDGQYTDTLRDLLLETKAGWGPMTPSGSVAEPDVGWD